MRAAIISDIHGNLPALEAALADARENGADCYIFAGDYIEYLPWTNEVLAKIRSLDSVYAVLGNGDERALRYGREAEALRGVDQQATAYNVYRRMEPDNFSYLAGLPKTRRVPLPYHGEAYLTHWVENMLGKARLWRSSSAFRAAMEERPFSHGEFLEQISLAAQSGDFRDTLRRALTGIDASVVISGHNHLQWHARCDGRFLINPGSCGMPLDFDSRASYTILEDTEAGFVVEEKRAEYDVEETLRLAKMSDIYRGGEVWRGVIFRSLETSREFLTEFFDAACEIALGKGESGGFFTNET